MRRSEREREDQRAEKGRGARSSYRAAMSRSGLSPGRSGNVSCRWQTACDHADRHGVRPDPPARHRLRRCQGRNAVQGIGKPSSEWRFHLAAYEARPDMGAAVHTHSLNATVLACAGSRSRRSITWSPSPAAATSRWCPTRRSARTSWRARRQGLKKRNACLMANHGQIALGATSRCARTRAEVEVLASQYCKALTARGQPHILCDEEMAGVWSGSKVTASARQD